MKPGFGRIQTTFGSSSGSGWTPLSLYCDASVKNTASLYVAGNTNIDWGDGSNEDVTTIGGVLSSLKKHTYSGISIYNIKITTKDLVGISIGDFTEELYPEGRSINEFYKAKKIKILKIFPYLSSVLTGSIDGLPVILEDLEIWGNGYSDPSNTITGDISKFINLKIIDIFGYNTINGDMSGLTKLVTVFVAGHSTVTGDISNWTEVERLEGSGYVAISGDISNLSKLTFICLGGLNTLSGNISGMTQLEYLSLTGNNTISGSINALTKLYMLACTSAALTGEISNLPLLEYFYDSAGLTKTTRLINNPKLCQFQAGTRVLTSAEINQLLADLWTNRDTTEGAYRIFDFSLSGGSPTGQGLIDKLKLRTYKSPNNTYSAGWTINTNETNLDVLGSNTKAWFISSELDSITKDAGTGEVSVWKDILRSGHDLKCSIATMKPIWDAAGVTFDGINDFLQTDPFTLDQPAIVYAVVKFITYSAGRVFMDGVNNTSAYIMQYDDGWLAYSIGGYVNIGYNLNLPTGNLGIIRISPNGASSKMIINGGTPVTGTGTSVAMGGLTFGNRGNLGGAFSNALIKEVICRSVADNSTDEVEIYNYLKAKYGL